MNKLDMAKVGRRVLNSEAEALLGISESLNSNGYLEAIELMAGCRGHVILFGVGKSGHVAKKIASSLASTGTPSFFVHPIEAKHGDLGMITAEDVAVLISYSGRAEEILTLIPHLKKKNIKMVSITGFIDSPLAIHTDVCVHFSIKKEACLFNLVPTVSTSATLGIGDALAITLMELKGFTKTDFSKNHPAGKLGRILTMLISDAMVTSDEMPLVFADTILIEAIAVMAQKKQGFLVVVDQTCKPIGLLTDGDLKRVLMSNADIHELEMSQIMIRNPKTVNESVLAAESAKYLRENDISVLIGVNDKGVVRGVTSLQALSVKGF